MISCGEASGDLYAGALTSALKELEPGVEVFGFGGDRLAAAGGDLIGDYHGVAVTGLVEALAVVPKSWQMLRRLERTARERRPDVFVAIDFPDFNLRLIPKLRRLGVPVVYYVSPQLWAWRAGRVGAIRKHVERMLVIFPFETALYEQAGVPVEFVGHPLVDLARPARSRAAVAEAVSLDPDRPIVALLPGSRPNEVTRLLPGLAGGARLVSKAVPGAQFLVARAPGLDDGLFAVLDDLRREGVSIAMVDRAADDVLGAADAVVTASGTATVQAALHGVPMVIVYRLSPLTYAIGRRVVQVSTYGMVNLVAGHRVVPELIQQAFTPEAVAREVVALLTQPERVARVRRELAEVRRRLGEAGASRRAAEAVLRVARRDETTAPHLY